MFVKQSLAFLTVMWLGSMVTAAQTPQSKSPNDPPAVLIYMIDRSASIGALPLPEIDLAWITEQIHLAELSGQNVQIVVIVFNGDGVVVFGDDKQMPTAAYKSLLKRLRREWPKPSGGTPLVEAATICVRMVQALPSQSRITVVFSSDGQPSSGVLQPDLYSELKAEMDRQRKAVLDQNPEQPAVIKQRLLEKLEEPWGDPRTKEAQQLLAIQSKAEFARILEHAEALRAAGNVRFVTIDYVGNLPELKEIHEKAGGVNADLITSVPPSSVIPKLHALGLTALPHVLVQKPKSFAADPQEFDRTVTVHLDPIIDAALVTVAFEPPIPDFHKHATMEVIIGGNTLTFEAGDANDDRILSFDSKGSLATATLKIDTVPTNGDVTIRYLSTSGQLRAPGCTVFTHMRLGVNVLADVRPVHLSAESKAPFVVSPNHPAELTAAIRAADNLKPFPAKDIELVLRAVRGDAEIRIGLQLDPQAPNTFRSKAVVLKTGLYDAELHVTLESGTQLTLKLAKHIDVKAGVELITIDYPLLGGEETEGVSHLRCHVGFPEVGDDRLKDKIIVTVRSAGLDYPLEVRVRIDGLVDSAGTSPRKSWITIDRPTLTLGPGHPEKIALTLTLPDVIEDALVDGPFKGTISFERADTGQPMPVKRFRKIADVPEDAPADPVTFVLRRPVFYISSVRCFREWVQKRRGTNESTLPVRDVVWQPFRRTVIVDVSHTSRVSRDVTALMTASIRDKQGGIIPSIRLVSTSAKDTTRTIASGATERFTFEFECDYDPQFRDGTAPLVISSPGVQTLPLTVEFSASQPLLGPMLRITLFSAAAILVCSLLPAASRWRKHRKYYPGNVLLVRPDQEFAGLFTPRISRTGELVIEAVQPLVHGSEHGEQRRPLAAGRTLRVPLAEWKPEKPLRIETISAEGDPVILLLKPTTSDPGADPEIFAEVVSPGSLGQTSTLSSRLLRRRLAVAAAAAMLAVFLLKPPLLNAAQWVVDFFWCWT